MTSPRKLALEYLARGWKPIPIPDREKGPTLEEWQNLRVTEATVAGHFGTRAGNVGVLLGEPSGWLIDVDLDDELARVLAPQFLPPTEAVFGRASNRASHWLYVAEGAAPKKFSGPAEGVLVELRSTGQQTVFPGSRHKETGEEVAWERNAHPGTIAAEALQRATARLAAAALLAHRWPVQGSRHEVALALAGGLLRRGWGEQEAADFIRVIAEAAGDPEVRDRVRAAGDTASRLSKGLDITGLASLGPLVGDEVLPRLKDWLGLAIGRQDALSELNQQYAVVLLGDKPAILLEESPTELRFLTIPGWRDWLRPQRLTLPNGKSVQVTEAWLAWEGRRQYARIDFAPGGAPPEVYNLFRGWGVAPDPSGECGLFLEHLRENVCAGDEARYKWALGWMADLIQFPGRKPGTALVLRGPQGSGKTIVGQTLGRLLGPHYVLVADPRYIVGNFNSHMVHNLLLHADEGFWAGDRRAEGKLKDLVTGDYQLIEFKGRDAVKVRNHVRLFVSGNHEWLVPAGMDERRFAVLDVAPSRAQDHAFFGAMVTQLEKQQGYGKLLHTLQTFDLSSVNLRIIPQTAALFEQKIASLGPEGAWWLDTLQGGMLPGDQNGEGRTPAPLLYRAYLQHSQRIGTRRRAIATQLGIWLKRHVPGLGKREGTYTDPDDGRTERRCRVYQMPSLGECRSAFDRATRSCVAWEPMDGWLAEEVGL